MSAILLNIKYNNPYLFAKLVDILDFNPKKLNIQKERPDEIVLKMLLFFSKQFKFCAVKKIYEYLQRYCTEIWKYYS